MILAKMSVYKRMKLACCFDCGRSERDCSCMAGSVHSNMDSLQRAFPLSSVSVHDCSTSLRALLLVHQQTQSDSSFPPGRNKASRLGQMLAREAAHSPCFPDSKRQMPGWAWCCCSITRIAALHSDL
ncbi:calcium-activated potassium channel subunit alpha-1a isoform X3 [Tachysurus ichikawai]